MRVGRPTLSVGVSFLFLTSPVVFPRRELARAAASGCGADQQTSVDPNRRKRVARFRFHRKVPQDILDAEEH
jgi:hypothetical protein